MDKEYIIEIIEKLLNGEGTDEEENSWMNDIIESVPFYEGIYNEIVFGDGKLSAEEIYEKAKKNHKPIIL